MIISKRESLVVGLAIISILGISFILYIIGMRDLSMFVCFSFVMFSIWWIYSFIINTLFLKKWFQELFEIWSILNGINFVILYILIVLIINSPTLHHLFLNSINLELAWLSFICISLFIEFFWLKIITKESLRKILKFIIFSFLFRYWIFLVYYTIVELSVFLA